MTGLDAKTQYPASRNVLLDDIASFFLFILCVFGRPHPLWGGICPLNRLHLFMEKVGRIEGLPQIHLSGRDAFLNLLLLVLIRVIAVSRLKTPSLLPESVHPLRLQSQTEV